MGTVEQGELIALALDARLPDRVVVGIVVVNLSCGLRPVRNVWAEPEVAARDGGVAPVKAIGADGAPEALGRVGADQADLL